MSFPLSKQVQSAAIAGATAKSALWRGTILAGLAFAMQGCSIGKISWVGLNDRNTPHLSIGCGAQAGSSGCQIGKPIQAMIGGVGECTMLRIHWGDGQFTDVVNRDLGNYPSQPRYVFESHTYAGWPGLKRVTVEGITNCAGTASADFMLVRELSPTDRRTDFTLGFGQPTATTCTPVPNMPPLRPNTAVSITTNTALPPTNYGCVLGGCIHDEDGKTGSSAPANFPFPGFREYSLVLRVGGDAFQGGKNTSFTTRRAGALEICVNDAVLSDNRGAWGLMIVVDERAAR